MLTGLLVLTSLLVLSGSAKVGVDGVAHELNEVDRRDPLKVVSYAEVSKDPTLRFNAGSPGQSRVVSIALGKNVEAGRLLPGFGAGVRRWSAMATRC